MVEQDRLSVCFDILTQLAHRTDYATSIAPLGCCSVFVPARGPDSEVLMLGTTEKTLSRPLVLFAFQLVGANSSLGSCVTR